MNATEAHQHFSAHCFNEVWRLLETESRSDEDSQLMRDAAHASLYHWKQREDCTPQNLSIGLWLLARVYAFLSKGEEAAEYAGDCISVSESNELAPFFLGYAFEAAARAAKLNKQDDLFAEYLGEAGEQLEQVDDLEDRKLLEADLKELTK